MSLMFINLFEVPVGRDDAFRALHLKVNDHMRAQPGYLSHELGCALAPDAAYRFANVARWDNVESFQAAHDDQFRSLVGAPEWREFPSRPTLYRPVHAYDVSAGTVLE